jgi:Iap family predicted aminopeptidase
MKELASRMVFETENTLRIIDRFGFDAVVQLNWDTPETPVSIKSVCKIDHWDEDETHNHTILDMNSISNIDTLARLVRMNQKFKVRQYHLKEELAQEYSSYNTIIKRKPTDEYKVSCDG